MASAFSLRGLFARNPLPTPPTNSRLFSTTSQCLARKTTKKHVGGGGMGGSSGGKGGGKSGGMSSSGNQQGSKPGSKRKNTTQRSEAYARVKILKQNMFSPAPPPLRMARLRHLRHWTIHRAWQLFRRQQHEATDKERMRMHAGMYNACEELRTSIGPGFKNEGYLYRVAMEKKNVYGVDSVPIEYARFQTDNPPKVAWNHDWKR